MKFTGISPIHEMNGVFIKREDLAHWSSLEYPSGSKVRQYMAMAALTAANEGYAPCLVGCSANSAMQIYVAATAKQLNTKGIIYTAQRKIRSEATEYVLKMRAELHEVKPGYLSNIRKHARQRAVDLKQIVQWDRHKAIEDTIEQCKNIPEGVKRIIVPTGSGLTAAGVLVGVAKYHPGPEVIAVCTSPMADQQKIHRLASGAARGQKLQMPLQPVHVILPTTPYDVPKIESLPDGTPLDPFYAAKAWKYIQKDDMLWPPGLRPIISMPEICQKEFKDWKGPQK